MKKSLFTIKAFARINAKRFFRDRLAIFFTIAFPLIFLIIFGSLFGGDSSVSFKVAYINQSKAEIAAKVTEQAINSAILNVDESITTVDQAQEKMKRSELDATVVLPETFGQPVGDTLAGEVQLYYSENNAQAAQALTSIIKAQMEEINKQLVDTSVPFTVKEISTNTESLSQFDYTFAGLLGFAIIGLGIFGPVNVFPELKKQGVLRRLHTTPLRVWEYFVANVISQGLIGLIAIAILLGFSLASLHC